MGLQKGKASPHPTTSIFLVGKSEQGVWSGIYLYGKLRTTGAGLVDRLFVIFVEQNEKPTRITPNRLEIYEIRKKDATLPIDNSYPYVKIDIRIGRMRKGAAGSVGSILSSASVLVALLRM